MCLGNGLCGSWRAFTSAGGWSRYLAEQLTVGDGSDVLPPNGRFDATVRLGAGLAALRWLRGRFVALRRYCRELRPC